MTADALVDLIALLKPLALAGLIAVLALELWLANRGGPRP